MTTPTNSLEKANQLLADQQLQTKIKGALMFLNNIHWQESHKDAAKDKLARQLHENYDYAAGRALQWLAFNDANLKADSTYEEVIESVGVFISAHPNGLWRKE